MSERRVPSYAIRKAESEGTPPLLQHNRGSKNSGQMTFHDAAFLGEPRQGEA